ncbi:MAG: hypothetical protein U0271_17395 [Polyangiaceae bacterium]
MYRPPVLTFASTAVFVLSGCASWTTTTVGPTLDTDLEPGVETRQEFGGSLGAPSLRVNATGIVGAGYVHHERSGYWEIGEGVGLAGGEDLQWNAGVSTLFRFVPNASYGRDVQLVPVLQGQVVQRVGPRENDKGGVFLGGGLNVEGALPLESEEEPGYLFFSGVLVIRYMFFDGSGDRIF